MLLLISVLKISPLSAVTTPLGVVDVDKIFHDFPLEDPANDDPFIPIHIPPLLIRQ